MSYVQFFFFFKTPKVGGGRGTAYGWVRKYHIVRNGKGVSFAQSVDAPSKGDVLRAVVLSSPLGGKKVITGSMDNHSDNAASTASPTGMATSGSGHSVHRTAPLRQDWDCQRGWDVRVLSYSQPR